MWQWCTAAMNTRRKTADEDSPVPTARSNEWIDQELSACEFKDVRLGKRFRALMEQLAEAVGESIPCACHLIYAQYLSRRGGAEEPNLLGPLEILL